MDLPLLLLVTACLLAAGCGIQGEPMPPLLNLPQTAELQAISRGDRVLLSWTMPRLTTEGQTLRPDRLGPAGVFMAMLPGFRTQVTPAEFQANAKRVGSVAAADLLKPSVEFTLPLPGERAGSTAVFGVKLPNSRGHDAGFSNLVWIPVLLAPPPPADVRVQPSESAIVLEWAPVSGASGYAVYRATEAAAFQPRAEVPAQGNPVRYEDRGFEFGKGYRYLVRSIRKEGEFRAESADSAIATIKPVDIYPPSVPAGLVAVVSNGAVELSWEPNTERDLAGYDVYRSENGQPPQRINKQLVVSSAFRDPDVRSGTSYSYSVTALDQVGNESKPSAPVTAKP